MSEPEAGVQQGSSTPARIAGALALLVAFALVVIVLFGGGNGYQYRFLFETGGQLVQDNQVRVAGVSIGKIDSIELTDDNQASIEVSIDEPLSEGTTAVIRSTSLSGVANRYIAISHGPDNAPQIEDGGTIGGTDTTTEVDLDQLFDVFKEEEREGLQKIIQGFAAIYSGKGKQANRGYRFLNPALNASERLFAEVSRDSSVLGRFLVEGADTFGAIADRRDQLASLVVDANTALGAIANQNDALDRSLVALPGVLRQANTTFVNLRLTLDDLDPLVEASYPGTEDLAPFLRLAGNVASDSKPVIGNLAKVVTRKGQSNDLADTLKDLPTVSDEGETAFPSLIKALDASQPTLQLLRPYTPDLFGTFAKLGQAAAYYDADGHYARVGLAAGNVFSYEAGSNSLVPIYNERDQQYDAIDVGIPRPCPGGGTQVAADFSNPFLDDGNPELSDCDPSDVPPG